MRHALRMTSAPGCATNPRSNFRKTSMRHGRTLPGLLAVLALAVPLPADADVTVIVGPTPIPGGSARGGTDITVVNEKLAFALAVSSSVPYGVPRGAIVDVAPVVDGRIGPDRVVFADFIPNNWSAWPNTYQKVDIVDRGPTQVVIRTRRDWGLVTIATTYTLLAASDHVDIQTTMTNGGDTPLMNLLSGLTLWPSSGYLLAVPGLQGVHHGPAAGALSDRVVAYDADWTVSLHAPYLTDVGQGSRDLLQRHTLNPGESRSFHGWLQVGASGNLAPVVGAEIERRHLRAGRLEGAVTAKGGAPVDQPVVIVEKMGKPYAWVLGEHGRYSLALPAGNYSLYATARNHTQTGRIPATIVADATQTQDFQGLQGPGRIRVAVSEAHDRRPLDARLAIVKGQQPVVEFLGRKTFFTELASTGRVEIAIAPGHYVLAISSGGGFLGPAREVPVDVVSGETVALEVALERRFDPAQLGWYSADLHHHADQAEAVTQPENLARSQLAAGLDVLFVSDHDSVVNHPILKAIAERRGVAFLPGVELSPSWGHFNAYPIAPGQSLSIDTSTASVDAVIAEGRRMGADVVQVNHPFIPYGYFSSVAAGVAPGGFSPGFDLIEMNAEVGDDNRVYHRLWEYWNEGRHYYLSAGTDTHDVWNFTSGRIRAYVHIDGPLTGESFAAALKAGHGYVSHGPLVQPSVQFGTSLATKPGKPARLAFDLQSVAGLKYAQLIGAGKVLQSRSFRRGTGRANVIFELGATPVAWYALEVADVDGAKAYTDPIWTKAPPPPVGRP